jgi:hypothetical protein
MAIISIIFGVVLLVLGASGYEVKPLLEDPAVKDFSLYPILLGVVLVVFGILSRSKSEKMRKIFAHVNATFGLIGLLLSAGMALNGYGSARSEGVDVDNLLLYYRLAMTVILLVYMNLCIRSFLTARAARKAAEEQG